MVSKRKSIPIQGRRVMYSGIASNHSLLAVGFKQENSVDRRCELVLAEIQRCENWKLRHIESSVLHNVPQVFVTRDLHRELEAELDRLLMEQLCQEEKISNPSGAPLIVFSQNESKTTIDDDLCLACKTKPCRWKSWCNAEFLTNRKNELYSELMEVKTQVDKNTVRSIVARSARSGGDDVFVRHDLINELTDEMNAIDRAIKLCSIDSELHQTCCSPSDCVTIRSIHGFDTTLKKESAISALEFERDRLIGRFMAGDIIESILEWMLEGWYFGERDDSPKTKTTSPSLVELSSYDQRGSLKSKAEDIQWSSKTNELCAANAKKDAGDDLNSLEINIKYALFCMTFSYFRALHMVRREKETWRGCNDLVTMAKDLQISQERKKMIEEKKNAAFRRARLEYAMNKARRGEERKRIRSERDRLDEIKKIQADNKQRQEADKIAITIQRVYRGYTGRRMADMRYFEQDTMRSANIMINESATSIARVWRGYCGRIDANHLRKEMAEFLLAIREEDARAEEDEYSLRQRMWFTQSKIHSIL